MQQRRVRLGDVLDDYCPRERRITNHAVVAMIDDQVKQTRCATCDAEHEYKGAKVPAPRRKKAGAGLSDRPEGQVRARPPAAASEPVIDDDAVASGTAVDGGDAAVDADPPAAPDSLEASPSIDTTPETTASDDTLPDAIAPDDAVEDDGGPQDDWVHRPLIRATLPRQEGQVPERKAPDFTLRQNGGRFDNRNGQRPRGPRGARPGQGQFRQTQGPGQPSGSRFDRGQGPRHGSGQQGPRQGQGSGHVPRHGSGQTGNRPPSPQGQRGGGRPAGQHRGPREGSGGGRKRGR